MAEFKIKKSPKIAREARLACEKWRTYFKKNIDQYHDMTEFVLGNQWEEAEEDMLVTNKKVPLTCNKLATLGNYLLGEFQQNTPQIQVIPMANATQETTHIRELITKDIMFSTDAQMVYQTAAGQAFIGGFGAYLIDTEYSHPLSWDQNIVLLPYKDPTNCYWDVGADMISKVDGMSGGYIKRLTRTKFAQIYGKNIEKEILGENRIVASQQEVALATDPTSSDNPFNWADDETITIIHHYKRTYEDDTLYKLSNRNTVDEAEMEELSEFSRMHHESLNDDQALMELLGHDPSQQMLGLNEGNEEMSTEMIEQEDDEEPVDNRPLYDKETGQVIRIEEKRSIKKSIIMCYKIAGDYVLEKTRCSAEDIPVVFVDQRSYYDKDGRQICRSFFSDCRDTQRFINYIRTQSAYLLKISRYDQFIGSKKNVSGVDTQRIWKDPQAVQGMLIYDESPSGAKPEQLHPPELPQSLLSQYELAIQDLYSSTGLYPTQMGQNGREISGSAIDARSRQGNIATQVPLNSINRAIETGGQLINQMIPNVYDAERVITLMTPDEGLKNFSINKQSDAYGAHIENDIRKGTFVVRLKPGPSYQGQKEEALESLQQVLQANPQAFPLIADLYAENLPLANNLELKNRLQTMVPPEIIEAGKSGKQIPPKPQSNPEQEALMMQAKMKAQELDIKKQELQLKAQEQQLENQRELMRIENERLEVAATLKEQELRYLAETGRTQMDREIANADNLVKILTHSPKIDRPTFN